MNHVPLRDDVVLDSGAVTFLAGRSARARALRRSFKRAPIVLSVTLLECLPPAPRDAEVNKFLKTCRIVTDVPLWMVRSAARARHNAGVGSPFDALVAAYSQSAVVVTSDKKDFVALASQLIDVTVITI